MRGDDPVGSIYRAGGRAEFPACAGMIRIGVRTRIRYAVNRIDEDYFDGEDL